MKVYKFVSSTFSGVLDGQLILAGLNPHPITQHCIVDDGIERCLVVRGQLMSYDCQFIPYVDSHGDYDSPQVVRYKKLMDKL
jgi:hypothetical protein